MSPRMMLVNSQANQGKPFVFPPVYIWNKQPDNMFMLVNFSRE
jgi:hypothetical protein